MTQPRYTCPVCGEKFQGDLIKFLDHGHKEINRVLRRKYPDYDETKGICPQCVEYFKNWFESRGK